jgi:hypothetical protein
MPIRAYVESGVAFSPELVSAMGKAFEDATATLGIGPDELKRQAVAKFIIRLAQEDGNLDAAALRDRTVAALRDSIHAASSPKDEKPGANRT